MNSYRYNNNISDINFRYVFQTQKGTNLIHRSIKVGYYKMLDILEFTSKKDDLGISYNKCTTRQLQFIQHLISKDENVIKCSVYVGDQIIL